MYINDDFTVLPERRESLDDKVPCSDGCGYGTPQNRWGVRERPVAMVYAPLQEWCSIYDADMGLSRGTIFAELDLPFVGCRGCGGVRHG